MDDKVYTPEVITDQPFPLGGQQQQAVTQDTAHQTYSPRTIQESPFPSPKVAVEVLSSALNTRSRKIIQEFQFTPSGALQIGEYTPGVSGDVRISPNGITARDQAGNTTFGLDGDTGDAVFAGNLQSGTLVTGQVVMGADGAIFIGDAATGQTIIDAIGLNSSQTFKIFTAADIPTHVITNTSYADISGSTITFTLTRAARALITLSVVGSSEQVVGGSDCNGRTLYRINSSVNGSLVEFYYDAFLTAATNVRENITSKPYEANHGVTLLKGAHTITLQAMISGATNFRSILNQYDISVLILGS